jgi:4-alpha-glucanotransferase
LSARSSLRVLADHLGVLPTYWDVGGTEHPTSDATREALCTAMGYACADERAAAQSCERIEEERRRLLEPVRVWREGAAEPWSLRLRHPGHERTQDAQVILHEEGGARRAIEARLAPAARGAEVTLPLPERPAAGYHTALLELGTTRAEQQLVVAPARAVPPDELLGSDRGFGIWSNLYTLRSRTNWGFGNFSDLADLARWCARLGGDFVGVNPLHALSNRGSGIAPYSPTSRLFRNILYLDIEAIPELAACDRVRARLNATDVRTRLASLRRAEAIDHGAILTLALPLLRELHRTFAQRHRGRRNARGAAYARYRAREGGRLDDFATFEVLAETVGDAAAPGAWRRWPAAYRDPRNAAVARFRRDHAEEIDFRRWLQFELDEQLARAARIGREAGLRVGLYTDLAVGSAAESADTWLFQDVVAHGVEVGAPPDPFAARGQNWGLPPFDPHRLRADGHRPWVRLLRAAFQHAGALRIDHVMGLQRLFWIPAGQPGTEGAYVRYPTGELLGILALESRRHAALVVGEDLGTVPEELPGLLRSWGILSSAVLAFERDGDAFRPPEAYSGHALVTAATHDLPPLAGWLAGSDLELSRRVGRIPSDADLARAREARARERAALLDLLREQGLLPEGDPTPAALVAAVHAFLARTPSPLVGLSLDDLAGETEPVNLPGVPTDLHRSWTRRMGRTLESLASDPALGSSLPGAILGGERTPPADSLDS